MKCQFCEKPATFHITEVINHGGPTVTHLCEEHARGHLQSAPHTPVASIANALAKQLQLGQTEAELEQLDRKECPVCGISFFEFRSNGRLGCPYDYTHFEADLEPLLVNIHDNTEHRGKQPQRSAAGSGMHAELIGLRRQMQEAVEREDYEQASLLRDQLRALETSEPDNPGDAPSPGSTTPDRAHRDDADGSPNEEDRP